MPELPEVEVYRRYFESHALRKTIARVRVLDERILGDVRKEKFASALRGRAFRHVRRHGKHLFADARGVWLHLHFGMTGDLAYYTEDDPRFARVVFDFAGGAHFAFEDMRLFGVADLTRDPETYIAEHGLGPDPLEVTLREFRQRLAGRRGAVKALLMSQDVIAGVGNLYADETLYQTSIHPKRPVDKLSPVDVRNIYTEMRRILRETTARKLRGAGYPPRYLIPHREEGEPCPRCGAPIARTVVIGRTTYYCPHHQP